MSVHQVDSFLNIVLSHKKLSEFEILVKIKKYMICQL